MLSRCKKSLLANEEKLQAVEEERAELTARCSQLQAELTQYQTWRQLGNSEEDFSVVDVEEILKEINEHNNIIARKCTDMCKERKSGTGSSSRRAKSNDSTHRLLIEDVLGPSLFQGMCVPISVMENPSIVWLQLSMRAVLTHLVYTFHESWPSPPPWLPRSLGRQIISNKGESSRGGEFHSCSASGLI